MRRTLALPTRVLVTVVPAAAVAAVLGGCGLVDGETCSGFALSLAVDSGGQASPEAAAREYAAHGGDPGVPSSGWRAGAPDGAGVPVTSGSATLHTVRVSDGTWFVDSGSTC